MALTNHERARRRAIAEAAQNESLKPKRLGQIWFEALSGLRCVCDDDCTRSAWGDRGRCNFGCEPCAMMAGLPYEAPPR